jgi:hypothetical protein
MNSGFGHLLAGMLERLSAALAAAVGACLH